MMKKSGLILLVCLFTLQLYPQVTISGTVRDQLTGEYLISATIFNLTNRTGTTTNEFGVFSLIVPNQDSIRLQIRYIGYMDLIYRMHLITDSLIDILLTPGIEISEVEIKGDSRLDIAADSLPSWMFE